MTVKKKKINEIIKKLPLEQKAEMAIKKAVAGAIAEHKRMGRSIAVWDKGKVKIIPPEKI
jgi:phosphorylcholine metabolism protein LicD